MNKSLTPPPVPAQSIPFEPAYITIPIYLTVHGRDENNTGVSQVDVLLSALLAYREQVSTWTECEETSNTVSLIDEIRDDVLDVVYNRLSESAAILRNLTLPSHESRR